MLFQKLVLHIILLLPCFTGLSQNLNFRHLTVEHGLSQNAVISIAQDKYGFMWFGTRYGLNRYDGIRFKIYQSDPGDSTSIPDNIVNTLLTDSEGHLWVGTPAGLCRYNEEADNFEQVELLPGIKCYVAYLYQDKQQQIWVGTNYGLLKLADKKTSRFNIAFPNIDLLNTKGNMVRCIYHAADGTLWVGTSTVLLSIDPKSQYHIYEQDPGSNNDYATSIAEDEQKRIWIGTLHNVLKFRNTTGEFVAYRQAGTNATITNIRKILRAKDGRLWIGAQDGISIVDPQTGEASSYHNDPANRLSISNNSVHSLYQDNSGTIWIGTYHGGINLLYFYTTPFTIYQNNRPTFSISSNVTSSITEDAQHNLWIGTEGGGLNYFNRKTGQFTVYKSHPADPGSIRSDFVKVVYNDPGGRLWVGTSYSNDLNLYNPAKKNFQHIRLYKETKETGVFDELLALQQTHDGTLWIGALSGLSTLRPNETGEYPGSTTASPLLDDLPNKNIHALFEDSRKNLWIGTGAGLLVYNPTTKGLKFFFRREGNKDSLQADAINCITEDKQGNIWVGTFYGGIARYNLSTGKFSTYTDKHGLPNNNVLGIVEDDRGILWISTDNGLARFQPAQESFKIYTTSDGIASNKFNNNSFFKDSKGELFFGGNNGLNAFFPSSLQTNMFIAPLRFTSLDLSGNPVSINDESGLLKKDIGFTQGLRFSHLQNNFTISWAMLNFIKPEKNRYAYMLEGIEDHWNYTSNAAATYTNLPAGNYTLLVKGANNDGIWTTEPARLKITILPPIWRTWYAYVFYVLALVTIIFFILRYLWLRELYKKEHELQQFKLNFFTNISHEIRTHLTLISGPVKRLLQLNNNSSQERQLKLIESNSERLTNLVAELIDFRKAETNNLPLHFTKTDIVSFAENIFKSFSDTAAARNIQTYFQAFAPKFDLIFDSRQMEKVIFNLLTNAFKFTPDYGRIGIVIEDGNATAQIHVIDNGKGISPQNIKKLFVNFFQVADDASHNTGYGIGLALSKSIVELHKGTLTVASQQPMDDIAGKTVFTIGLPKDRLPGDETAEQVVGSNPVAETIAIIHDAKENIENTEDSPVLLLVEDNTELRSFITESLSDHYRIIECSNGHQGWQAAIEQMPELVISDVMMPGMDGFELCNQLKHDVRTSHIPVILLTAKTGHENQVAGLSSGADAYITKPFSLQLLELQAVNLVAARRAMRLKFGQLLTEAPSSLQPQTSPVPTITLNATDQDFMDRFLAFVEEHIDDPEFHVGQIATKMLVSPPILYKKLKALTDMTVNDFVKSLRLKRAAELLQKGEMNINEVAYAVGFNRRKYFSEEFKKTYGKTPSEYGKDFAR